MNSEVKYVVTEHTIKIKYPLLKKYFNAYTKVISNNFPCFYYVDGFSVTGICLDKERGSDVKGSPIIALELDYPFTNYTFVENIRKRNESLEKNVKKYENLLAKCSTIRGQRNKEVKINIEVIEADINDKIKDILSKIPNYPCLIFLDPEGLELKWNTVKECSKKERVELLINFSIQGIIRNIEQDRVEKTIDEFFGIDNVKRYMGTKYSPFILEFYEKNIKKHFKHVVSKAVKTEAGNLQYYLIFATNSDVGFKIMKYVMGIKGKQLKLNKIL